MSSRRICKNKFTLKTISPGNDPLHFKNNKRGRCAAWQTSTPKPWWFSSEKQDAEWALSWLHGVSNSGAPVCNYRFHAYDGLLDFGHVGDVVFIGAQLPLLYSFIDSNHHVSGYVCAVIHTWNGSRDITQEWTHATGLLLYLCVSCPSEEWLLWRRRVSWHKMILQGKSESSSPVSSVLL